MNQAYRGQVNQAYRDHVSGEKEATSNVQAFHNRIYPPGTKCLNTGKLTPPAQPKKDGKQ